MDRAEAVRANVQQLRELDARYPGQLKLLRSEGDVDAVDMNRIMEAGMPRTFDNADPELPQYVHRALGDGKQVVVVPAGRQGLMITAGHGLFGARAKAVESSSGCFIATAAYGSALTPEIAVFRRFRDEVLLASRLGRLVVRWYYRVSPPVAALISRSRLLRIVTRRLLLQPILRLLQTRYRRVTTAP